MAKAVLGIDLGGSRIKAALVTPGKEVLGTASEQTPAAEGPSAVMDAMDRCARRLVKESGLTMDAIEAAGIGAPGPMNWQTGIVYSPPNLKGWKDVPLGAGIAERLKVPCFVDNDANAACYGEFWLGAGRGSSNLCLLTLGTGIGGGMVIEGELVRGPDGTAGEVGHMKVARGGRLCGCGARGCLEAYASAPATVRTAVEALEKGGESVLSKMCGGDREAITAEMIGTAAREGDPLALDVLGETGEWLGLGIASLVNLLNPEKVILAGGMAEAGDLLFETIRKSVLLNAFEVPAARAEIIPSALGPDSGAVGAAGCALLRLVR